MTDHMILYVSTSLMFMCCRLKSNVANTSTLYAAPCRRDSCAARHFAVRYTTGHAPNTNSAWPEVYVILHNKSIIIIQAFS